jgi:hypothetical protein
MSGPARLRVVYVERGASAAPIVWLGDEPSPAHTDSAGQDVHRVFSRLLAQASFDGGNGHGRLVRAGRSLLAETDLGWVDGRRLKATVVVSAAGGRPGWAKPCAEQAAAVLHDHGLAAAADRVRRSLEHGWRDSAGRWQRRLTSLWRLAGRLNLLKLWRREAWQ